MSPTSLIWIFLAASVALSAMIAFSPRLGAAKLALLSRLRSSKGKGGHDRGHFARRAVIPAAVFLLVAGIGAGTSYYARYTATAADPHVHPGQKDEALAHLQDYTRSIGAEERTSTPAPDKLLPDVRTMIARLAVRLESAPDDLKGWRTLGWSYFNTGLYKQAAAAYAKAVELDPKSAELRQAYEEANAKASETGEGPHAEKSSKFAAHSKEEGEAIRAMVDGLAARLESSPQDVDGWARLMRSRVVLGERDVAATALRKALEIFKDDPAATGKITAAATELGLKSE